MVSTLQVRLHPGSVLSADGVLNASELGRRSAGAFYIGVIY